MTINAFKKENSGLLDVLQVITIQHINLCNHFIYGNEKTLIAFKL